MTTEQRVDRPDGSYLIALPDGREALVTARVEAQSGRLAGLLEVVVWAEPLGGGERDRELPRKTLD